MVDQVAASQAPGFDAGVPVELVNKLREANQRFHTARKNLEQTMDDSEYRHQERVNEKEAEFRRIEKEVEDINMEILKYMDKAKIEPDKQ